MLEINDVLRPQIINIGGRRYRHLPQKELSSDNSVDGQYQEEHGTYVEEGMVFQMF